MNLQAVDGSDGEVACTWDRDGIRRSPTKVRVKNLVSLNICKSR